MRGNYHFCFIISALLIFYLPGVILSDEERTTSEKESSGNTKITDLKSLETMIFAPFEQSQFSLHIIRPKPDIDPAIAKNTFNPDIKYSLRIINPYTKKETSGCKKENHGGLQHKPKISWIDKLFSMNVIKPDQETDAAIVNNTFDPSTNYESRIVDPYRRNMEYGYSKPGMRHK
jgi:hypothetical protein